MPSENSENPDDLAYAPEPIATAAPPAQAAPAPQAAPVAACPSGSVDVVMASTAVVPGQSDDYSKIEATGSLTNNYPESISVSVGLPPSVLAIDSDGMMVLPVNYGGFDVAFPEGTARPDRVVIEPGATVTWRAASTELRGGMPPEIASYVLDEYNPARIGAFWKDIRTIAACGSVYVPQRR